MIKCRELNSDLITHSAFRTVDDDIDLKVLVKNLSSEAEAKEEADTAWHWESLFAEVSGSLVPA